MQGLRDASLAALAKHGAALLEVLDVSFCRDITDAGVGMLVDAAPALARLEVWGCSQLTDDFYYGHRRAAGGKPLGGDDDAVPPPPLRIVGRPGDVMPARL